MASLSFTETTLDSGKVIYIAEISSQKGSINVDLERETTGLITVYHRLHGSTNYKGGISVPRALNVKDINFNIINEASEASMDYQIVSDVSATGLYS